MRRGFDSEGHLRERKKERRKKERRGAYPNPLWRPVVGFGCEKYS